MCAAAGIFPQTLGRNHQRLAPVYNQLGSAHISGRKLCCRTLIRAGIQCRPQHAHFFLCFCIPGIDPGVCNHLSQRKPVRQSAELIDASDKDPVKELHLLCRKRLFKGSPDVLTPDVRHCQIRPFACIMNQACDRLGCGSRLPDKNRCLHIDPSDASLLQHRLKLIHRQNGGCDRRVSQRRVFPLHAGRDTIRRPGRQAFGSASCPFACFYPIICPGRSARGVPHVLTTRLLRDPSPAPGQNLLFQPVQHFPPGPVHIADRKETVPGKLHVQLLKCERCVSGFSELPACVLCRKRTLLRLLDNWSDEDSLPAKGGGRDPERLSRLHHDMSFSLYRQFPIHIGFCERIQQMLGADTHDNAPRFQSRVYPGQ